MIEAALGDWVKQLTGFTQGQIETASQHYLRSQPNRRPTPADIRSRINGTNATDKIEGDKSKLSVDQIELLETQILPTARRWLSIPGLADRGKQTLAFWGEYQEGQV